MSDTVVVAVLGIVVPTLGLLGGGVAFLVSLGRKLGNLEAITKKELTHNGGGSMKDWSRDAREDAAASRTAAEYANARAERLELAVAGLDRTVQESRAARERDTGNLEAKAAKLQHDLTNVRVGQGYLVHQLDRMDEQRLAREVRWALKLQSQGLETPDPLPTEASRPLPEALEDVVP